jgi:hypothetical protein
VLPEAGHDYTFEMPKFLAVGLVLMFGSSSAEAPQIDYEALWAKAAPFHEFLENVRARSEQWLSRFSNAAIDAGALSDARALTGRRRILVIAEDRCSDSAWAVPYIAKLAAAVPDKLEVRVLGRRDGRRAQAAHLTPDGRLATPTILILDEQYEFIGAWVERPAELQKWFIEKKAVSSSDDLHDQMTAWYTDDAGRSTIREILSILGRMPAEGK